MCGAISPHQTGSVHSESHRKLLQTYIVYYLIVGSLQESRIYGNNRLHALRCKASGEGDSVLFGDPHVKAPVRELLRKLDNSSSIRHSGSNNRNPLVLGRQFDQRLTESISIRKPFLLFGLTGWYIKRRCAMEFGGIALCEFVSLAFFRQILNFKLLFLYNLSVFRILA